jgi:hypothetical protein
MAATPTGVTNFDTPNGNFEVGSTGYDRSDPDNVVFGTPGVGTYTVDAATDEAFGSTHADYDPLLLIGVGEDAVGTVTVTGASTSLTLDGENKLDWGAGVEVGTGGGKGTLNILAGGVLTIDDSTDTDELGPDFDGGEYATIGAGDGGDGSLFIDGAGSKFEIIGAFGYLGIGTDEGTGVARISNEASLVLHDISNDSETVISDPTSRSGAQVGTGVGATGTLEVLSNATIDIISENGGTFLEVGVSGGSGDLVLGTGARVTLDAAADFSSLSIGLRRDSPTDNGDPNDDGPSGDGSLTATGAVIEVTSTGGFAGIGIGENGGVGEADLLNGTSVNIETANGFAKFAVGDNYDGGQGEGGSGRLAVRGGTSLTTILVKNLDGGAEFKVADGEDAAGLAVFEKGALGTDLAGMLEVDGSEDAGIVVGRGADAMGSLSFDNGSVVMLKGAREDGGDDSTFMQVGSEGGAGTLVMKRGSTLSMEGFANDSRAGVEIGKGNGSSGWVEILSGAQATITAAVGTYFVVGQDGGEGMLLLDGAGAAAGATRITFNGNGNDGSYMAVGRDGGSGKLVIANGAEIRLNGDSATLEVGQDGGRGDVLITAGGKLLTDSSDSGFIRVGGSADGANARLRVTDGGRIQMDTNNGDGTFKIGSNGAGSSAEVVVSGFTSTIIYNYLEIGFDDFNNEERTGSLFLTGGTTIGHADGNMKIARGGTLIGGSGNNKITGFSEMVDGGRIDMRDNLLGTLTFLGDTAVNGTNPSYIALDVNSKGNDKLVVNGNYSNDAGLLITLNAISNYKFLKGDVRTIATMSNGVGGDWDVELDITGQQSDFSYYAGFLHSATAARSFVFHALNKGDVASNANRGVLNFGIATSGATANGVANLIYDITSQTGTLTGGKFGSFGGMVANLDQVIGTNGGDTFTVSGTATRTMFWSGKNGNDTFNTGLGVDDMAGGNNDDIYVVNNIGDIVRELVGTTPTSGNDTVMSFISFSLANTTRVFGNVENLTLMGSGNIDATGNKLANLIQGNGGKNTIAGGGGTDILFGGGNHDTFLFNTALATAGMDTIMDFNVIQDMIHLDQTIFTKLALGAVLTGNFVAGVGPVAADADDFLLYDTTTGILSYDSNGNLAGGITQIAQLTGLPNLTVADFLVIP